MAPLTDRRGLLQALVKDGRPLIVLTALALLFSGGFPVPVGRRSRWLARPVFSARSASTSGSATRTPFTSRRQFWERRSSASVSC